MQPPNLDSVTLNFKLIARRLSYCHKLETLTFSDTALSDLWGNVATRNRFLWMNLPQILGDCGGNLTFNLRRLVIQVRAMEKLSQKPLWYLSHLNDKRLRIVDQMNVCLGVLARLERVSPADCSEEWFWEEENGKYLQFEKLTKEERRQRKREYGWN